MQVKDASVNVRELIPAISDRLNEIEGVVRRFSLRSSDLVITSGKDGLHKQGSKHYTGAAIDIRIWAIRNPSGCVVDLQQVLGPDYDVILEKDHIHLEYDPA